MSFISTRFQYFLCSGSLLGVGININSGSSSQEKDSFRGVSKGFSCIMRYCYCVNCQYAGNLAIPQPGLMYCQYTHEDGPGWLLSSGPALC